MCTLKIQVTPAGHVNKPLRYYETYIAPDWWVRKSVTQQYCHSTITITYTVCWQYRRRTSCIPAAIFSRLLIHFSSGGRVARDCIPNLAGQRHSQWGTTLNSRNRDSLSIFTGILHVIVMRLARVTQTSWMNYHKFLTIISPKWLRVIHGRCFDVVNGYIPRAYSVV